MFVALVCNLEEIWKSEHHHLPVRAAVYQVFYQEFIKSGTKNNCKEFNARKLQAPKYDLATLTAPFSFTAVWGRDWVCLVVWLHHYIVYVYNIRHKALSLIKNPDPGKTRED